MEQLLVNLYAGTNILFLIWYIRKYGLRLSPGLLILSFYVLIAILAIPAYRILQTDSFFSRFDFENITLIPYFFLFIVTALFLYPTFSFKNYIESVNVSISPQKTRLFIIFYTICSLFSIYCYYRTISQNVTIETLAQVRQNHYAGETLKAYNNFFEHIVLFFTFNLNVLASIVFFYILSNTQIILNKWWIYGLGLGVLMPPFMVAIMTASRGMIIGEVFQLMLCYSYFEGSYSRKLKKTLIVLCCLILVIFWTYSMLVTQSRFGKGDDAFSSLVSYFGQPTLVFNSQTSAITDYALGARFFYPWLESFGIDPETILKPIVKSWNPCFDTFVGDLYVDFGPIGTIILALIISYFVTKYFSTRKSMSLPNLYLMTFYCVTLQHGALVTGYGFCMNIVYCIVIYYLSKFLLGHSSNL